MFGGKMKGDSGSSSSISPLVSFTLGAAMATVCVLFFMSASPGRRLVDIAAWSHNNGTAVQEHLRSVADADDTAAASDDAHNVSLAAAPAPAPAKAASEYGDLEDSGGAWTKSQEGRLPRLALPMLRHCWRRCWRGRRWRTGR